MQSILENERMLMFIDEHFSELWYKRTSYVRYDAYISLFYVLKCQQLSHPNVL